MRFAPIIRFTCCIFAIMPMLDSSALTLPPVVHYDTETSTNMPFTIDAEGAGRLTLSLSCLATPSNNVEAAFGRDVDQDGVLSLGEMAFTIGWDCGAWFVRQGCDGVRIEEPCASTNEVKTFVFNIRFSASGLSRRIESTTDGQPVFATLSAAPPEWLNIRQCNRLRLTGRGLDGHGESFAVGSTIDAITIRYR